MKSHDEDHAHDLISINEFSVGRSKNISDEEKLFEISNHQNDNNNRIVQNGKNGTILNGGNTVISRESLILAPDADNQQKSDKVELDNNDNNNKLSEV